MHVKMHGHMSVPGAEEGLLASLCGGWVLPPRGPGMFLGEKTWELGSGGEEEDQEPQGWGQSKAVWGEVLLKQPPAGSLVLTARVITKQAPILALFQAGSKRNF